MKWSGSEIRAIRKQLGMTQAEFAKKLGYKSREAISHIEREVVYPIPQTILLLDILKDILEEEKSAKAAEAS